MKSNMEKKSTLGRKLSIEIPAVKVDAAFTRAFKGLQKTAHIKGFRKGKVPLQKIKSLYGDQVQQNVLQDIVQKHYQMALDEHSLEPVSFPDIQYDPIKEKADFKFTAEFEIKPEVVLKNIEGLNIEKEKIHIGPDQIDEVLQNIRKGRPDYTPIIEARPVQDGDVAVVDFDGYVDGQIVDSACGKDLPIEIGSNKFIPGFEEGLVGMAVGASHSMNLAFPENYKTKDLAGKPVTFKVLLKEMKKKTLPEINDDFAKNVADVDGLDKLKELIEQDLIKNEEKRVKDDMKTSVLKSLTDQNHVDVPQNLQDKQKETLIKDVHQRMHDQGLSHEEFEEYIKKWDEDFNKSATFMIQSSFLINEIAKQKNLNATDTDFDTKIKEYAKNTGIELVRLKTFYKKDDNRGRLYYQITEEKVVDFLISKATVKEVEAKKKDHTS